MAGLTVFGVNFLILEAEVHLGEEEIEVLLGEAEGEELKQLKSHWVKQKVIQKQKSH